MTAAPDTAPDEGERITLGQVAREQGVGLTSVRRWVASGVRVPGGTARVRLAARRVGGYYRTTRAAVEEFLAALNPGAGHTPTVPSRADRERRDRATIAAMRAGK